MALISCCGIGELIKHVPAFREMMKMSPQDAQFWRCSPAGHFKWARKTHVTAYETAPKKQKCFEYAEEAPDELYEEWTSRGVDTMNRMIAEDAAAQQLNDEALEQMDGLIEDAVGNWKLNRLACA